MNNGLRVRVGTPSPVLLWTAGLVALLALEAGAALTALTEAALAIARFLPGDPLVSVLEPLRAAAAGIPTLLSREVIPNQGWRSGPTGPWRGTFLGLSPALAWGLRVALVYAYAGLLGWWCWRGYRLYRTRYREAAWTPRDAMLGRLRGHRWGQFGFAVVAAFLVLALFAPALSPTTVEQNIREPYEHEVRYFDEGSGTVETIAVGDANLAAASNGAGGDNTGIVQYDRFGRFHPFGTLPTPGKDLFTFLAAGARVSLFIGLTAVGLGSTVAAAVGLVTAYLRGVVDLVAVVAGDSVMSIPQLLFLLLVARLFRGTALASLYNGAVLIALLFAFTSWPFLWRAIRGPAFRAAERPHVDAAESYGQRPLNLVRVHMFPEVLGYLLVYASMTVGGVVIGSAALAFLGLGVQPPTPAWGRAIAAGQAYVATPSWHVPFVPGVAIVLVVTGFNALGDGIRDALDPRSRTEGREVAAAGGGGG